MRFSEDASRFMACILTASLIAFTSISTLAAPFEPMITAQPGAVPSKAIPWRGQEAPSAMTQMPLILPLFIADRGFTSTLTIVNMTALSTYADVVISGADGSEITRKRVEFQPHSPQRLDISTHLLSAISPATAGSIAVMQDPELGGMAIAAQLSMTYTGSAEGSVSIPAEK
jgi:hypothetical protein